MDGGGRPSAVFMAFGTKGDVLPIAAIAATLSRDQPHYHVVLITHSAHQSLRTHLASANVDYIPISSPPALPVQQLSTAATSSSDSEVPSFSALKKRIQTEHRRECLCAMERVFGDGPSVAGDFVVVNFFSLEGWSLAELYQVRCVVAAPYVVPYSAPSSFERRFKHEYPLLYKYFQEAPPDKFVDAIAMDTEKGHPSATRFLLKFGLGRVKTYAALPHIYRLNVCWRDVIHWMWPLFLEDWGSWRSECLNLSPLPFTDPVTNLPMWHIRAESPLLLYGFSKEIVECPGYWPSSVRVCGFWFLPVDWQFSCRRCREMLCPYSCKSSIQRNALCSDHADLQHFLMDSSSSCLPIFVGLSSIVSMGFLKNPVAFLLVLKSVLKITSYRFVLFTAGYEPLDAVIKLNAGGLLDSKEQQCLSGKSEGTLLFNERLFCFTGSVAYSWLFPRCAAAIHHGGSGSTAAALEAGIPQILCPFILDQFYWSERLFWLGVAPEPLQKQHLVPDTEDGPSIMEAAKVLSIAIEQALSPATKEQASKIAQRIHLVDGVAEALKVLLEEKVIHPPK